MWRIDPKKAGYLVSNVGQSARRDQGAPRPADLALGHPRRLQRDHERGVLPGHGEEPHGGEGQGRARQGARAVRRPRRHAPGPAAPLRHASTRRRSTRRSRPRPTSRRCRAAEEHGGAEAERAGGQALASGTSASRTRSARPGRIKNEADGYYQTKTNEAKAHDRGRPGRGRGRAQGGRGARASWAATPT